MSFFLGTWLDRVDGYEDDLFDDEGDLNDDLAPGRWELLEDERLCASEPDDIDVIWRETVDGVNAVVERTGRYRGRLILRDADSNRLLANEDVELTNGAILGPEVCDTRLWRERAQC